MGPRLFEFAGKQFQRIDFELLNPRGLKIVCSIWEPTPECRSNKVLPCVIYMHGNSSARVEALTQLTVVLSLGATLVSFDFTGSGKSDGEYVSLGAFEKDDLKCVIAHLRGLGTTSSIALWGRSMGAATALLHGERDPSIAGMVLDSAFADLQVLAEEMVEKGRQHGLYAPNFLVSIAIRMIRGSVQKAADFDIKSLCPIQHAHKCFIPALFVAAEGDEFVPPHHSQQIYQRYAGDKNIIIVEGDHNSARPRFLYDSASIFLVHVLQIPDSFILDNTGAGSRPLGAVPWSSHSSRRKPASFATQSANTTSKQNGSVRHPRGSEDSAEVGMTNERQAELRTKLYTMLGDRGSVSAATNAASTAAAGAPVDAAPTASVANATIPASTPSSGVSSTAASVGEPSPDESDTEHGNDDDGGDEGDVGNDYGNESGKSEILSIDAIKISEPPVETEWTCDQCTLVNAGMFNQCFACDAPRTD